MLDTKKTIIIAEACENHFGSIINAKKNGYPGKKKWSRFHKISTSYS